MTRLFEQFVEIVKCKGLFRSPAEHMQPVAGLSVLIVRHDDYSAVEVFDGSKCVENIHVAEHQHLANPVTTDSKGHIDVCLPHGTYEIVVSGAGIKTARHRVVDGAKVEITK